MTTSQLGVARYLDVDGTAVHAVLHTPAQPRRTSAVLLLAPFGWDDTSSYRVRRAWAASLADDGYHVLRFDLPGSGDSAGSPRDPERLAAWTDAIAAAASELRGEAGCARVAAVGFGLGGLLGLAAIDAGAAIDEIVLWAVPARGRSIVRELKAFAQLEASRAPDAAPLPAGAIVVNGYLLSAETAGAINELDVASMGAAGLERALLLGRDGLPVDDALRVALESAGAHVTVADGPGYGAMTAMHQESRPPLAVMACLSTWLEAGTDVGVPAPPPPSERCTEADVDVDGVPVRERLMTIEHDQVVLAGVLAEPVGTAAPLTAVLLNAGAQRRIGPNRMWVEAARRLAARGVPTMRVDLASIGDSGGRDRFPIADGELYEGEFGGQVGAVLDQLVDDGLPSRFLLMGLCSGAYWSFWTGQQDERVAGVVLLNPLALVFDPYAPMIRRARRLRRLAHPSMWWRLLRGDVARTNIVAVLRAVVMRTLTAPARFVRRAGDRRRAEAAGGTELDHAFDRLHENRVRAQLVFSPREPLCEELTRAGFFDSLDRWPNVRLHLLVGPPETHTLQPLVLQRQVHDLLDAAVDELLVGREVG